ncbi:hypothetical protein CAJAP_09607 [Camponotus japonicus]
MGNLSQQLYKTHRRLQRDLWQLLVQL